VNLALLAAVILICLGLCEIAARSLFGDDIPMYPRYHTSAHYGEFTLVRDVNAALGIAWRNRFVTVNAAQPNESMAA
jgi:hypothetical protein